LSVARAESIVLREGGWLASVEELAFKLWRRAPRFERRLEAASPALVHAHFGPDAFRILPVSRRMHIPLIATFHGFDATTDDYWARRSFYGHRAYARDKSQLYSEAVLILAISEHVRKCLIDQGFPENKVRVLYTGIDLSMFCASNEKLHRKGVIFVGRLVEIKGVEYLIRAMAPLQQRYPDLTLTIVGDGPLRRQLEAMASRMLRRFEFRGTVSSSEVKSLLLQSRVFCGPSIRAHTGASEGLGMVFLEAQAMGVPVVAFSHGGIPEAVRDRETGLLVPEGDWNALSARIESLITDDAMHARFSQAAREHVRRHFDIVRQSAMLEDLYDEARATYSRTVV